MKSILSQLFQSTSQQSPAVDREHLLRVATATLMVEVCRADFDEQGVEVERMGDLLSEQFALNSDELDELMAAACEDADRLVSIQHITRLLNERFDQPMKARVIEMMWQLAYADGFKSCYEEHLIRQVSDLLYLPHASFIQARHKAEPQD